MQERLQYTGRTQALHSEAKRIVLSTRTSPAWLKNGIEGRETCSLSKKMPIIVILSSDTSVSHFLSCIIALEVYLCVNIHKRSMKERIPYRPQLDMQQIHAFDERLRQVQGTWTTIGRSFAYAGAPGVIRLQWCDPDECWCDERSFLDQYTFRLLLRCFLRHAPMTRNKRHFVIEHIESEAEVALH